MSPRVTSSLVPALALLLAALPLPSCSESGPPPDEGIRALSAAIEEGRPEAMIDAFPPRYVADVEGLVHRFGEKMDPEVWDRGFVLFDKVVRVLEEKRDLLLKHPMVAMMTAGEDPDELKEKLDGAVASLRTVVSGPLSTVEGLKSLDLDAFLRDVIADSKGKLVESAPQVLETFGVPWLAGNFTTEVVSQDENVATIRVVPGDGSPAKEMQVAKVDGHWVSKSLADSWETDMANARAELEKLDIDAETKTQFLAMAEAVEGILDELLAAENEVQFGQAIAKAMQLSEQF